MSRGGLLFVAAVLCALPSAAAADCRALEIDFKPVANLQIAVWIEDAQGHYVDTAYVTRLTGALGLANRPGNHLFKTDFRFPYGRRDMVMPVWAYARNHHSGYVVMGGAEGNTIAGCEANGGADTDCDDNSIGYHFGVSSPEPFYCSPQGGVTSVVKGVDVVSCASAFYGSKGAYAAQPLSSLYPPRADLTTFVAGHDGPDAMAFSKVNDLVAISGATPAGNAVVGVTWTPPADGAYVIKLEASLESDFNASWNKTPFPDDHSELNGYGHNFLGQPSIVYSVPFTVGAMAPASTAKYAGYGQWDGSAGTLNPPDSTITDSPGTGAGRLLDVTDGTGTWRLEVKPSAMCPGDGGVVDGGSSDGGTCAAPAAPTSFTITPGSTSVSVSFASAVGGATTTAFQVRYSSQPITDQNFDQAIPSSTLPPPPGVLGSTVTTSITGLRSQQTYYVAARALSVCQSPSPVVAASFTTLAAQFATLHGCFIATAAYGTPQAKQIDVLRRLRDRQLLPTPLGRLAVATYYALSPPVANAIATDEHLRAGARAIVQPLVDLATAAERANQTSVR